jgi:diguanylate cyclase (GGDEF)-like protein
MNIPLRLVVVEDNEADVELLTRCLIKAGLDVVIHRVDTEHDLVSALHEINPDLILSDFSLPQFNGVRALEVAVAHAPHTPFIYVSGTIGEERAIDALRRGATDYVLKGNLSRLPSAVQRALGESSLKADQRKAELQRRDQELRLQRLTRTYRMLSNTSSAILRLRERSELLSEVCRIAVQLGGYLRVSVSLLDADGTPLGAIAWAGDESDTLLSVEPHLTQACIAARLPEVHNDIAAEHAVNESFSTLIQDGCLAVAAVPLCVDATPVGAVTLFSSQSAVFDDAEMNVVLELTANLGFALQYLEKDAAVHFLSYFDTLTGLAKRALFCQRASKLLAEAKLAEGTRAIAVFDIQKLGAINDSYGRYVGDLLIQTIAERLKQVFNDPETIAYFGGGTFALTLSEDSGDIARLWQNVAAKLFAESFQLEGEELRPLVRCGVAIHLQDGATAEALVQNAETALKAAREENEKYQFYKSVKRHPTSRGMALEARLEGALDRGEFLLHYQPKVNVADGRLEGFEALLRWKDVHDGLVSPVLFVPLLERSGAIVEVGEWVMLQATHDIREWFAASLTPVRVAVNVSPLQLRRRDFVDQVLSKSLAAAELGAGGLDIEITESMLMQDLELSISKLSQLRDAGIAIAIDDFGTGYSSLSLLASLPVDTLKIDRSFVHHMVDSPKGMSLVATIVSLARSFDLKTVAEGVETAAQLHLLHSVNCDQAQGFLFQRPAAAVDVPGIIARFGQRSGEQGGAVNSAAEPSAAPARRFRPR